MGNCCTIQKSTTPRDKPAPTIQRRPQPLPLSQQLVADIDKNKAKAGILNENDETLPLQVEMVATPKEKNPKSLLQSSQSLYKQLTNAPKSQTDQKPKRISKRLDLSVPIHRGNRQIYRVTSQFPVQKPYATASDFDRILERYRFAQNNIIDKKFVAPQLEKLAEQLLALRNRNWQGDLVRAHQQYIHTLESRSLDNLVKHKLLLQLREHFNWLVWAIALQYLRQGGEGGLPRSATTRWSEGFEFKGLFVQLHPIEEASHVLDEVSALAQVQIELMQTLCNLEPDSSTLVKQMLVPLITVVKFGAFLIYATPLIYAEDGTESSPTKVKSAQKQEMPTISSISEARIDKGHLETLKTQFSHLHQDPQNKRAPEAAYLAQFPLLQNLKNEHLIPILDLANFGVPSSSKTNLTVHYLLVNVADCTKSIKNVSDLLFVIPSSSDNIFFQAYPSGDPTLSFSQIKTLIAEGDQMSGTQGASFLQPKGDTHLSPRSPKTTTKAGSTFHPPKELEQDDRDEDISTLALFKSGWYFLLVQAPDNQKVPPSFHLGENKRATQLIALSHLLPSRRNQESAFKTPSQRPKQLDSTVFGSVLVSAHLERGFKLLPAATMVSYPQGVECVFKTALESVAKLLNLNHERVLNVKALKELMHRKGLNMRFLWLLMTKVTLKKARALIMVSLLLRVVKKSLYEKIAQKCRIDSGPFYNASKSDSVYETVAMFVNALLKNKFAKYKHVFDEVLLGLFIHRLKILPFAATLGLHVYELNYLESSDILDHVIESGSQNPTLFMNSVQMYFRIQFQPEFVRSYRQDCFQLLHKQQPLTCSDFKRVDLHVLPVLTLRDHAYFVLARLSVHSSSGHSDVKEQVKLPKLHTHGLCEPDQECRNTCRASHSYSKQRQDTHRNFQNLNTSGDRSFNLIDLSKKRHFALPQCEITLPVKLYRSSAASTGGVLKPSYDFPSPDKLNEWVITLESILKDCHSICTENSDQVLIEALNLQAMVSMLIKQDIDDGFKIIQKVRNILQDAIAVDPETVSFYMLMLGLFSDTSTETDFIDSERNYLGGLIGLFAAVGDPRGRGNSGLPIMMFLAWKLQILAQASKKTQDSELAEELFDACLHGFSNYKKQFKMQTQQVVLAQEKAYLDTERSQHQFGLPNQNNKPHAPQEPPLSQEVQFEAEQFNIKKYKERPKKLVTAGGFIKTKAQQLNSQTEKSLQQPQSQIKATSFVHQKKDYDAELSEIDLEFDIEVVSRASASEPRVEIVPFPHWMINRQVFQQQSLSLAREDPDTQKEMLRQLAWDTLNNLQAQSLMQWLIQYNPSLSPCGLQWDSQTLKEFCFGQQSQLHSNSGSSAAFSHSGRSLNSSRLLDTSQQQSSRRRHLSSYSQILNKDVGGILKHEISGTVYIWGSDQQGQIGLDNFCPQQQQKSLNMNSMRVNTLKLMHPRVCVPLKDEVIKEVCCGYSFTFAVNHYGQTYSWGANECGQLGLGPSFMSQTIVRSPQLNPYLSGVTKIQAGNEHALALTKSGELYIWGSAALTGLNDEVDRPTPTILSKFSNQVRQISCGGLHSMVLTKAGQIYTWGSNEGGQLGLSQSGDVDCIKKPTLVKALVEKGQIVTQIAAGETHAIALTREHKIWGWGMSMYGQLGLGFSADSFEPGLGLLKSKVLDPQEITPFLPQDTNVVQVFCGSAFTLFQTKEGELYGCGINDLGQLGLDTYVEEMQVHMLDRKRQQQQLSSDVVVPSRVICFEKMNVQSVACGENHSLAVIGEDKNMLWSWGMYKNGQLGLGHVTIKMNPRPIQTLCASHIHGIAAGSQHSVALLGESTTLNSLTQSLFVNTDALNNPWTADLRSLGHQQASPLKPNRVPGNAQ